jgi:hypothetical protein
MWLRGYVTVSYDTKEDGGGGGGGGGRGVKEQRAVLLEFSA